MPIRIRGNTKHTQRDGFTPNETTVEWDGEMEDYVPGTIHDYTLRVHDELVKACQKINAGESGVKPTNNPFATIRTH